MDKKEKNLNKNKTKQVYSLGINIQMEECKTDIVRYLQCGIEDKSGFTGHIWDYVGGAQYQDFYFLNGKNLDCYPDGELMGDDEAVEMIEESHPGLMKKIEALESQYAVFTEHEGFFFRKATDLFKTKLKDVPDGMMFVEGVSFTPVTVGNTTF